MPGTVSSLELTLDPQQDHQTLTAWLYAALRRAILDGRLRPGTRLPATRDFAKQYGVARGTVVEVFEQLQVDGFVSCRVGAGTWVNQQLPRMAAPQMRPFAGRPKIFPDLIPGLAFSGPAKPFRMDEPALSHFPSRTWMRLAAHRLRRFSNWLEVRDDARGYLPLREAVSDYLASSRGVECSPLRIAIVSGVQQGLDFLARLLLAPGDRIWMEDPGYFGASVAFRNAGAKIVPVPVDKDGLLVAKGRKLFARPKGVYVTPGHQFPLGVTMSLERRLELLKWAGNARAFVIEDDYDGDFRFEGRPLPVLQSMDGGSNVILVGTFNKLLFPNLRLGYIVLPESLVYPFLALRYGTDLHGSNFEQAVLCDFITQGHFGRHIRRMRDLYASRLESLLDAAHHYLGGLVEIQSVRAGLYTAGILQNGMNSQTAERLLWESGVETMGLHRFTSAGNDPGGFLMGFAAFDEKGIRRGIVQMAKVLECKRKANSPTPEHNRALGHNQRE